MAKWEIRFQRSARSFRPLGFDFSIQPLAFSIFPLRLQPLAFAIEPREATPVHRSLGEVGCPTTCRAEAKRRRKPFTRAKWEIRFQRFALSFRLSAKALVCGLSRKVKPYTRGNEKFHLSPIKLAVRPYCKTALQIWKN